MEPLPPGQMNLAVLPGKVFQFAGFAILILVIYALLRSGGLYQWTGREADGLTVLIQLLGNMYAVLLAFMIFVIWTQFTEVENCVTREADSLHELLRYSTFLNDDARAAIRKAVFNYVRRVLDYEWPELAEGRKEDQTAEAFARLVATAVSVAPKDLNERLLHDHLLDSVRTASRNRDERVAKSCTRMPPTLSGLVKLISGVLLLLVFVYPFHQAIAGAICVVIAALVLFVAHFVMTDTDNPLKGVWNVRPNAFSQLPH